MDESHLLIFTFLFHPNLSLYLRLATNLPFPPSSSPALLAQGVIRGDGQCEVNVSAQGPIILVLVEEARQEV